MNIRKTTLNDLDLILGIYAHARKMMRDNNNPNQWGDSYPLKEDVIKDINNGDSYLIYENSEVYGVFSLIFGEDPTYSYIEGKWLNDNNYATIHKIASNNKRKCILEIATKYALSRIDTVRIDTYKDNSIMIHLIDKLGYSYCGIIYVRDHSPRLAVNS